jgi:hypothetical protein
MSCFPLWFRIMWPFVLGANVVCAIKILGDDDPFGFINIAAAAWMVYCRFPRRLV